MATDLTTIFGSEINVAQQPRIVDRYYHGFAAAHGVTCMFMGTRGSKLAISGRIAVAGANYNAARTSCQAAIDAIETYLWAPAIDYSFRGTTFFAVVFDQFSLISDSANKVFHWCAGYCICDFTCHGRCLL